ncbi:unnamed protein product [Closterium sp. NIES-54]
MRHTCTDLGELRSYLGLRITQDRSQRTITLTQSHMVQQVLQRFSFTYSLPQSTPLPTGHSLSAPPSDESVEPSGPYPELVGCLMYLMTCTRPDLAYPLSLLARYVAPGRHRKVHWDAAKRVLRYLCSTSGMGLVLGGRARVVLTGHADASWVDDLATQRSSQGYTFSLGSGYVSWRSTRSSSVLSSSCEAEIHAWAMAAQGLRWLTYLLTDLGEAPRSPPVLYVDNKAMLALCQEHRLEHRTKHISLRYFLARELLQHGQLRLAYVASQANNADVFTKALQPLASLAVDKAPISSTRMGSPSSIGEQQTREPVKQEAVAGVQSSGEQQTGRSTRELSNSARGEQQVEVSKQLVDDMAVDKEGELTAGEESTDSDMVEVPISKPELRHAGRARRPPERLSFHAFLSPAAFTAVYDEVDDDLLYDDTKEDEELPELDPDMHADPKHCWDIATMTVKQALASWKGEAVKTAMEEEIRSLIGMGNWELVERPRGVNIMKSRWTYSPVSSYVTLRIFHSIVAVFDLNLMQLDMKNAFLQNKLDRVLYMYQPDYFNDGTGLVCKLLKSLYGLKQSPLLWYRALDGVLLGAGWKKSQVDEALYFKADDNGVIC